MRTLHTLTIASSLLAAAACGGAGSEDGATIASDSAGIAILSHDILDPNQVCVVGAEPEVVIGSADATSEYELYRVFGASKLGDGRIAVLNQGSHEIRYYDSTGRHLQSTGREGRGPGEFANAFLLWVLPGDTAWAGDYRPWQFHVFGPDGQWVRTVRPEPALPNPPGVVEVLDDGRILLANRPITSEGENWSERYLTVVLHGPDGSILDTIGTYPNGRWGRLSDFPRLGLYPLFESFFGIDARGGTVVMGHGSRSGFSMYTAADSLVLQRIVRWNAGDQRVTRTDIAAERQKLADRYSDMEPAMYNQIVGPLISEERPVADEFPAFVSLRLGKDGRTWVRSFARPAEPSEQHWLVFKADGTFGCHARLPEAEEFYEFGADYILALDEDDLGIERVVMYSLTSP